jgi:hypothetical protein
LKERSWELYGIINKAQGERTKAHGKMQLAPSFFAVRLAPCAYAFCALRGEPYI